MLDVFLAGFQLALGSVFFASPPFLPLDKKLVPGVLQLSKTGTHTHPPPRPQTIFDEITHALYSLWTDTL